MESVKLFNSHTIGPFTDNKNHIFDHKPGRTTTGSKCVRGTAYRIKYQIVCTK